MKRPLLSIFLFIAIAFVGAVGFVSSTEKGFKWLFVYATRFIAGDLSAETIHGRLIGPMEIGNLRYKTADTTITLDRLAMDWRPMNLFYGRVHIVQVNTWGLKMVTKPAKEKAPPLSPVSIEIRLPLSVVLEKAFVRDVSISKEGVQKPVVIDELFLRADSGKDGVKVHEFRIKMPEFEGKIQGMFQFWGDYPVDLQTDWTIHAKGFASMRGNGNLNGNLKKLNVKQTVSAPAHVRLDGTLHDLLAGFHWEAKLDVLEFSPQKVNKRWPSAHLIGRLQGNGDRSTFQIDGSFQVSQTPYGDFSGTLQLQHLDEKFQLDKLILIKNNSKTKMTVRGEYIPIHGRIFLKLNGKWEELSWPLTGDETFVNSSEGKFSLEGSPDDYHLKMNTRLKVKNVPSSHWILSGKGNLKAFSFESIFAEMLDGIFNGKGNISWEKKLAWDIYLTGKEMDPSILWPDWSGKLDFRATSTGTFEKEIPTISLKITNLEGILRGYPVRAVGDLEMAGNNYTIRRMELQSGSAFLSATGHLKENWELDWNVDVKDLETLIPGGKGFLVSHGKMVGPRSQPRIIAFLHGKEMKIQTLQADELRADLDIDLLDRFDSRLDLTINGLYSDFRQVDTLTLLGKGKTSSHELIVNLKTPQETMDIELQGHFKEQSWNGLFHQVMLTSADLGTWTLEEPGTLAISADHVETSQWCWVSETPRICLKAGWRKEKGMQGTADFTDIPFKRFQSWMPPDITLTGMVHGRVEATYNGKKRLTGQVQVNTSSGAISYKMDAQRKITFPYKESILHIGKEKNSLDAKMDLTFEDGSFIHGEILFPRFTTLDTSLYQQEMKGSFQLEINNLEFLPAFSPVLENTQGIVKADLTFTGTPKTPSMTGQVALVEGIADIPDLGIRLEGVKFLSMTDGKGMLKVNGEARSGKGIMHVDGKVKLKPDDGWPAKFHIKGERFEAARTPEVWILASPDVNIFLKQNRVDMEGELLIPEATIETRDLSGAVAVSQDVLIMNGKDQQKHKEKWRLRSKIRLKLGDKVTFQGFGISGRITGDILLVEEPEKVATGTGQLQIVEGKYKAYGQKLDMEEGRLVYANSPADNPGLDIRAVRPVGDVVTGINIRGTLKDPELTLFSNPPMDQADILSYLVLGRPLYKASSSEGDLLYQAAASLSLSGGELLTKRIGRFFGLEEVRIEKGETLEEAALLLGKHLSPRLYVSYGIGLLEPISTIRLRYQITSKWLLQTETGIESGADLLYKMER